MEISFFQPQNLFFQPPMCRLSTHLKQHRALLPLQICRRFLVLEAVLENTHERIRRVKRPTLASGVKTTAVSESELRENWLSSLSSPLIVRDVEVCGWVVGIDPDASGALALLKGDGSDVSAQVFDTPTLQVLVGKRVRKRLDPRAIVQLLCSLEAPLGTIAYIEQSNPFPKDGKQGWWSGGFGYGMWIGILVASGFSVVPVPSQRWKNQYDLSGSSSSKDDSRSAASSLFPSMSTFLRRKMDHGRAEALLIAAYGKGLKLQPDDMAATRNLEVDIDSSCLE